MNKKLTIEFIKEAFEKEGYTLLSKEYINCNTKLNYMCSKGHEHSIRWSNWQQGQRCSICSNKIKPTLIDIKEKFKKEGYILLSKFYKNNKTKLEYLCPKGHNHSIRWHDWKKGYRCGKCSRAIPKGGNNKYDVIKRNIPLYDTYNHQINYCEETRRDPNEPVLLQIKCTKCKEWFTPTRDQIKQRIRALEKYAVGSAAENKFYCSNECKNSCSIFKSRGYFSINKEYTSAELIIWGDEVLKRAGNICEYCGKSAEHAHHIQPKKLEPFYALDPDNGVACCVECHYKHGHNGICSTNAIANIICK